ncbi:predicted protein [Nematostella vectensis]|uniref:Uncharacterized protein n=1 Tax=Nematostella vectensis TaxID=45351 RepID=A7SMU2_NEMVE|nr:hairy/enhancer-of-split related with YRPW motif protein 1 [Nematostella vectensis]EDO34999.1 predicted protein [Nematostella vectensis]|eukprot:XP_001627099.1 predicted protein [Nematostella vectensis]
MINSQAMDSRTLNPSGKRENRDDESVISVTESFDNTSFSGKKKANSECSHKVIEKRRRDRINSCLSELAQLIPSAQNGKQGSGKLEKAEILELTVEYVKKNLQNPNQIQQDGTDKGANEKDNNQHKPVVTMAELRKYWMGYSDCTAEVLRFLVAVEAMDPQQPCFQRLMAHLRHRHNLMVEYKENGNSQAHHGQGHHGNKKNNETGTSKGKSPRKKSHAAVADEPVASSKKPRLKEPQEPPQMKLPFIDSLEEEDKKSGNGSISGSSSSNENGSSNGNGSSDTGNGNGNGSDSSSSNSAGSLQFGNVSGDSNMHLRNQFMPQPYGMPTYALHPAGTHYIPVALHSGIPMPQMPFPNFSSMLPVATMLSGGLGPYLGGQMQMPVFPPSPPMSGIFPNGPLNIPPFPETAGKPSRSRLNPQGCKDCKVEQGQEGSGPASENESNSSGDECSFTSRSSGNMSEIGVQTDHAQLEYANSFSPNSR